MMSHHALIRLTAGLVLSLVTGCSLYTGDDPPPPPAPSEPPVQPAPPPPSGGMQPPAPGCTFSVDAPELVCTYCAGDQPGHPSACMAARCVIDGLCLSCTDPRGNVARDCSMQYDAYANGSFAGSANARVNFATCAFTWGAPNAAGTTCNYPGPSTCKLTEVGGARCLSCDFPDGSHSGQCAAANVPLRDPLIDRPDDLPAPGRCVSDPGPEQAVQCTTCTHADLSATRTCRFPTIVDCDLHAGADGPDRCLGTCTFTDGHQEQMCQSSRGLHPVP